MAQWRKVVVSGSTAELNGLTLSGDLTVTGGDITLGSTSIFSGGDTAQLSNIDALDATTEATIESAIDTLSNLTAASSLVTVSTLDSGAISSGFGNIDIGTSTLNAGNTTVDTLTNDSTVAASHLTGSFTGSFTGDGSSLTGVAQDIDLLGAYGAGTLHQTQDKFLLSDNGTEKSITFSNLEDSVFANVSGDATIAAGGALTIAAGAVENSMLANSTISGISLGSNLNSLSITANGGIGMTSYNGSAAVSNLALDIDGMTDIGAGLADADLFIVDDGGAGTNRKTEASRIPTYLVDHTSLTSLTSLVAVGALNAGSITSGFGTIDNGASAITTTGTVTAGTLSVTGNATVTGDLAVNGTVTTINTTNLAIKDKFILVNSGSASGDGGVVVQTATDKSGTALFYDDSNSRWGLSKADDTAHDATTASPRQWISSVSSSAGDPPTTPTDFGTTNQYFGMMYVNSSNSEIWIYS